MGVLASGNPLGGAPLPGFLNSVAGPVQHWGYGAIALLLLLENIGIPVIPGELAMIAGAILAGTGRGSLNVVLVGVVAVTAAIVGAEIGYLIGKFGGRELILRYGKYVLIKPHHLDRAEAIVDRYGGIVVVIARFIVGLREANGFVAGISQMRLLTFTFFNVFGACAWVATWVTIGYVAGDHISSIYADVNRFALYLLIVLAVALAGYIAWRILSRSRRVREHRGTPEAQDSPATVEIFASEESSDAQEGSLANEDSEIQEHVAADDNLEAREDLEVKEYPEVSESLEVNGHPEVSESLEVNGHPEVSEDFGSQEAPGAGKDPEASEKSSRD